MIIKIQDLITIDPIIFIFKKMLIPLSKEVENVMFVISQVIVHHNVGREQQPLERILQNQREIWLKKMILLLRSFLKLY